MEKGVHCPNFAKGKRKDQLRPKNQPINRDIAADNRYNMYIINKEFHFSASHILLGLRPDHPCSRLHGHNYVVNVYFRASALSNVGFVIDYRDLEPIKQYIDNELDHRHLNDILPVNPTAEHLAKHFYDLFKPQFPELYKVEISETPKTKATYEAD